MKTQVTKWRWEQQQYNQRTNKLLIQKTQSKGMLVQYSSALPFTHVVLWFVKLQINYRSAGNWLEKPNIWTLLLFSVTPPLLCCFRNCTCGLWRRRREGEKKQRENRVKKQSNWFEWVWDCEGWLLLLIIIII
jgi:hypothetical protein